LPRLPVAAFAAFVVAPFASAQVPLMEVERLAGGTTGAFGEPIVQFFGAPVPNATLALSVGGAPPLAPGVLALSTQVLAVPVPFVGGLVHLSPLLLLPFVCDTTGYASHVVAPTFVDPALVGIDVVLQALVDDASVASGAVLSDAVRLRIGARSDIFVGRAHATALEPLRIFPADLDADGREELVVTGNETGLLFVHRVADDGGLAIIGTHPVGSTPTRIAFADFDGDGHLDAVVTNFNSRTISQLRGTGDGSFEAALNYTVGSRPFGVAVGDVNGDSFVDVVVANSNADTVSVLRGTAAGTFLPATTINVAVEPREIALADINGDGALDLVIAHAAATGLTVHRGFGNGNFGPSNIPGAVNQVTSLHVLDFDGDSDVDIVALASIGTALAYLSGNGNGTFAPVQSTTVSQFSSGALIVTDMTGDGTSDALYGPGSVFTIRPGSTSGSPFGSPTTYSPGGLSNGIAAVDVNADERLDVLVARSQVDVLTVHLADENRAFDTAPVTGLGVGPDRVQTADFDGDGLLDIVTAFAAPDRVVVRLGLGDGTFGPEISQATVADPAPAVLTDFDGDGETDLVVTSSDGFGSVVHLGAGDGSFAPGVPLAVPVTQFVLDVVDFDADGVPDLLTSVPATGGGVLFALRGDGSGGYQQLSSLQLTETANAIELAHLDDDDLLDLVVVYFVIDTVTVHLGSGIGQFAPASTTLFVGDWPNSVTIEDLDLDGFRDLVVPCKQFNTVSVFYNDGAGAFTSLTQLRGVGGPPNVVCADLDGNGVLDLAAGQLGPSEERFLVKVFLGIGGRQFAEPITFWSPVWSDQLVGGDFDDDGRADLGVVTVGSNGLMTVLLGR
jgi:hypothetical protein